MPKDPDVARFPAAIEELVRDYLRDGGCPCRFPRFRATVERETDDLGAPMMTWEQYLLITRFDSDVRLASSRPVRGGRESLCAVCGATIRRRSEETYRDQWTEHMRVLPRPGVSDLGAPSQGALPRCWPLFTVGVKAPAAQVQAEIQYPHVPVDEWLAWMRAR
jgi:hypothetical protein